MSAKGHSGHSRHPGLSGSPPRADIRPMPAFVSARTLAVLKFGFCHPASSHRISVSQRFRPQMPLTVGLLYRPVLSRGVQLVCKNVSNQSAKSVRRKPTAAKLRSWRVARVIGG
jgi:hypothetical protein